MASASKLTSLLDSLPESENIAEHLKDIKILLLSIHRENLADIVRNVSFDVIFNCLQTEESEDLCLCCDVLGRLLSAVDGSVLLHQFHSQLMDGMHNPAQPVKLLALTQIVRAASVSCDQVADHPDVLQRVIEQLASSDLQNYKLASQVLVHVADSREGLQTLMKGETYQQLVTVMNQSDIIRYRVYETIVAMACGSVMALSECSPILQRLTNDIDSNDVLLQLNCLQLVGDLASTDHGYAYLNEQLIINRLSSKILNAQNDPLAALIMPGLLKVFGHIGYNQPEEVSGAFSSVVNLLFNCLTTLDPGLRAVAVETVGHIGSTNAGKEALSKQWDGMISACQAIGKICNDTSEDIRCKALQAATDLISLQSPASTNLLNLTEQWFTRLFPGGLGYLQQLAQQPYIRIRAAAFGILTALAQQPLGPGLMMQHPGFIEYLLNRGTETQHDGKIAKFEVIDALVTSPIATTMFDAETMIKFRAYKAEGPFHVKVESTVAFEGD